jgi:hypothetical protein
MEDEQAITNLVEYAKGYDSQSVAAAQIGISAQYLCDLLKRRRTIPNWLADHLASKKGQRREIRYVREKP